MDIPTELSMEQQFRLRLYQEQVKNLTQEQAQQYLLEVLRQMMMKDNLFIHLSKNS